VERYLVEGGAGEAVVLEREGAEEALSGEEEGGAGGNVGGRRELGTEGTGSHFVRGVRGWTKRGSTRDNRKAVNDSENISTFGGLTGGALFEAPAKEGQRNGEIDPLAGGAHSPFLPCLSPLSLDSPLTSLRRKMCVVPLASSAPSPEDPQLPVVSESSSLPPVDAGGETPPEAAGGGKGVLRPDLLGRPPQTNHSTPTSVILPHPLTFKPVNSILPMSSQALSVSRGQRLTSSSRRLVREERDWTERSVRALHQLRDSVRRSLHPEAIAATPLSVTVRD